MNVLRLCCENMNRSKRTDGGGIRKQAGFGKTVYLRLILCTLREMTDIKELTPPTLVNSLIERIEVHSSDKSSGHSHVKVDIYFTAVGMIDITTGGRNPSDNRGNTEKNRRTSNL